MMNPSVSPSRTPTVTFLGAAQTVTGSMHLIELGAQKILLDCGKARTRKKRARNPKVHFPFEPASISAVVLSHAHIDHCGNLPSLVQQGFEGPIFCTSATRDLIGIMLQDSARFQPENLYPIHISVDGADDHVQVQQPRTAVEQVLHQCVPIEYGERFGILPNVQLEFFDAGHVLGSAISRLTFATTPKETTITFTGDLGRRGLPWLNPVAPVPASDLLISESTYGGRQHRSLEEMIGGLAKVARRTFEDEGLVLIPAFSLGRTQLVVHYLEQWIHEGLIPNLPIYVDSPMGARIAEVHEKYPEHFLEQALSSPGKVTAEYIQDREESDDLADNPEPCYLVASGGTCDGGRIIKHLRNHIDDPRSSLVLVSFQPPGTLGEQLLQPQPTAYFHGRAWNKWIEIAELNGFSGHAGQDDFLAFYEPLVGQTSQICLVHGEPTCSEALAEGLNELGFADVKIPAPFDKVTVRPT